MDLNAHLQEIVNDTYMEVLCGQGGDPVAVRFSREGFVSRHAPIFVLAALDTGAQPEGGGVGGAKPDGPLRDWCLLEPLWASRGGGGRLPVV